MRSEGVETRKMKIYINSPKEDWVADRYRNEWIQYNKKIFSRNYFGDKLIWIISPWTWRKIPKNILSTKSVLCTIHHIDEDKFNEDEKIDFLERDNFVDHYHAISEKTYNQLKKLTKKPISIIPFWINQNIWNHIENKDKLRKKYGFNRDDFLIGTFQRDTEGSDLISPKLSKGPDRLIKIYSELNSSKDNLKVVLAGRRRQYIINELEKREISFSYFEDTNFESLNELYNILDLYIVASRFEGGPASIMESAITKTPIISTNVGIASEILHPKSLFDMDNAHIAIPDIDYAFEKAQKYTIPKQFEKYKLLFETVYEN